MGLFGKKHAAEPHRQPSRSAEAPADTDLTFLTQEEAQHIRNLARSAFADAGLEVTVYAGHVQDEADRKFGLWNVAAACHQDERGRPAWPSVVQEHVARVLASMDAPDPFAELTDEQVAAQTFVRLYDAAGLPPNVDDYPHVEFAPGILATLALDLPETVAVYNRDAVEGHGRWAKLFARGIDNLRGVPVEELHDLPLPGGQGHFTCLLGDSVFTGSRALLMPQLAIDLRGESPTADGWLLSIPNRHQLCWHVIKDATVIPAIDGMLRFTMSGYADAPGPVSPHVFWWSGRDYRQLSQIADDGSVSVHIDEEFQAVLERLVG